MSKARGMVKIMAPRKVVEERALVSHICNGVGAKLASNEPDCRRALGRWERRSRAMDAQTARRRDQGG